MKNKRIDAVTAIISFGISLLTFGILLVIYINTQFSGAFIRAVSVGAIFALPALTAFVFLHISAKLRQRIKIQLPALATSLTAIIVLLCFVAGFIGQILYSFHINIHKEDGSDIVLMLDDSGSMVPYNSTVRSASRTFVDGLSENCRLAVGIFAEKIGAFEDLTIMDSAGKERIKKVFDNSFAGGTNLDVALEQAYNCLAAEDTNKQKAVVLLTDGQGYINNSIKNNYIDNNILLYTIRISGSEGIGTEDLIDFVNNTGGFDTVIDMNTDSSISINDLLQAFQNISGSVNKETSRELLVYDKEISVYKVGIRFVFLLLLAFLVQFLYFREISVKSSIENIVVTVISCIVMTFAGVTSSALIAAIITAAAIFTAIAKINIREESSTDV